MAKSWTAYYENTKSLAPSRFLVEAIETFTPAPGLAIDLGCGAGRDTRYLLEHGYQVIAVDNDPSAESYIKALPHQDRLTFIQAGFEDFHFSTYDLVNAHYALPFVGKANFERVIHGVIDSIKPGGLFVGQLFGLDDEWNTAETKLAFCERKDVEALFADFATFDLREVNEKGAIASGDSKHWHVFNIIAKK